MVGHLTGTQTLFIMVVYEKGWKISEIPGQDE